MTIFPLAQNKTWRWRTLPDTGRQVPCPMCRAVDVNGQDVIEWGLVWGCWPCVFGLGTLAGKRKRLAQQRKEPGNGRGVVAASSLIVIPCRKCGGAQRYAGRKCDRCRGTGYEPAR